MRKEIVESIYFSDIGRIYYNESVLKGLIEKAHAIINKALERYSVISMNAFCFNFPVDWNGPTDNTIISNFLYQYKEYLKNNNGINIYYLWTREKDTVLHPHFHVTIFNNMNRARCLRVDELENLWYSYLFGCRCEIGKTKRLVHQTFLNGKYPARMISRNDPESISAALMQIGYIAKVRTKIKGERRYGGSQIN